MAIVKKKKKSKNSKSRHIIEKHSPQQDQDGSLGTWIDFFIIKIQ